MHDATQEAGFVLGNPAGEPYLTFSFVLLCLFCFVFPARWAFTAFIACCRL